MNDLPKQYRFLMYEGKSPAILREGLKLYGTKEFIGEKNNPEILAWAREIRDKVGLEYKADSTPWCGLYCGVVVHRAGYEPPFLCIRAKEWLDFGKPVSNAMLGDILVFERKGGGHVGIYVGEDKHCYHVLGGNQGDEVSIVRMDKTRCIGGRRPIWKIVQPPNVRKVILDAAGKISHNEA